MAIVVLLDQRGSRSGPDLVHDWEERLNRVVGEKLALPFTRTAGDEMQAMIGDPAALGHVTREVVASDSWWMGVGVGSAEEPLPDDTREGRGPAFWAAREAIRRVKTRRASRPVAVSTGEQDAGPGFVETAARLDACLGALAFIVARRTAKQQLVADAYYESGRSLEAVIDRLGLSPQGARQRLVAAGGQEEHDLIRLTASLAGPAVDGWADRDGMDPAGPA